MLRKRAFPPRSALAAAAVLGAVGLAACGADDPAVDGGLQPAAPSKSGLPPELAKNVEQADKIIGEGREPFQARLKALKGHPVVVNQWASWCESCRFEFPFFRSMTTRYRGKVAFLGLDSQDERGSAEEFLKEFRGGFPSVFDPDTSVAASLGGGQTWPMTFFFDEKGEQVHTKIGAYATAELLDEDIRRFALGRGP